jgi:hypothetical protein
MEGGIMDNLQHLNLVPLSYNESYCMWGGSEGWDYDIARLIGRGAGYSIRKMWRLFQFLSENLYEMQANTQVIYK